MRSQLHPCNNSRCWSDPVITEAVWIWDRKKDKDGGINVVKGSPEAEKLPEYEHFGEIIHCPKCEPDVTNHKNYSPSYGFDGDDLCDQINWNADNPISHEGKWLLENALQEVRITPVILPSGERTGDGLKSITCTGCESKTQVSTKTDKIKADLRHSPTCALITEARLPLKTKDKND